jgi:hypothetical protein
MYTYSERQTIIWQASLPGNEKLVLLAINSFVDGDGKCWPSLNRLAQMTGFSRRTIQRSIDSLTDVGFVDKKWRSDDTGRQTSSLYAVNFDALTRGGCQIDTGEGVRLTRGGRQIDTGEGVRLTRGGCQIDLQTDPFNRSIGTDPLNQARARFENRLPPWKTGRGPNDWNEDFLRYLQQKWTTPQIEFGRADAIAYIARRQHPDHPDHPALIARFSDFESAPRQNVPSAPRESPQDEFLAEWRTLSNEEKDKRLKAMSEARHKKERREFERRFGKTENSRYAEMAARIAARMDDGGVA